jgi:hypothetical protein
MQVANGAQVDPVTASIGYHGGAAGTDTAGVGLIVPHEFGLLGQAKHGA